MGNAAGPQVRRWAHLVRLRAVHHPISYFQAIILGLTQGVAEPFPVSSLGHGVVIPRLFGWNIHQNDKFFLAFLVATHLGTATVPYFCFFRDCVRSFCDLRTVW